MAEETRKEIANRIRNILVDHFPTRLSSGQSILGMRPEEGVLIFKISGKFGLIESYAVRVEEKE